MDFTNTRPLFNIVSVINETIAVSKFNGTKTSDRKRNEITGVHCICVTNNGPDRLTSNPGDSINIVILDVINNSFFYEDSVVETWLAPVWF
eukprot:10613602-Heterocapsa_arctica.AAC.1